MITANPRWFTRPPLLKGRPANCGRGRYRPHRKGKTHDRRRLAWVAQSSFMQFETVTPEGYTRPTGRGNIMKLSAIALVCVLTLSSTFAFAHGHRRYPHHMSH